MFNYIKSNFLFCLMLSLLIAGNYKTIYGDVVEKNYSITYSSFWEWTTITFKIKANNIEEEDVYVFVDDLELGYFSGRDAELDDNGDIIIEFENSTFTKAKLIKLYAKCKKGDVRTINFYNSSFDSKPAISLPVSQFPNFVANFIKEFEKL